LLAKTALLCATGALLVAQEPPVGSTPTQLTVETPDFEPVKLMKVTLCRYSKELNRWVGEFTARRDPALHPMGKIDLRLNIAMKNGTKKSIALNQLTPNMEYWRDTDDLYKPEDVASFSITITRESWIDEAKQESEDAAKHKRIVAGCRALYNRTANKKIADLTVKEEQAVRACQQLNLYPP
jgi:hypothetical protein